MTPALPIALLLALASWSAPPARARAETPDRKPGEQRAEAAERFDHAMALIEQHDDAGALAELLRVSEIAPHPRALYNLGLVYAALNRPVEATRTLDELLAAPGTLPPESLRRARATRDEQERRVARLEIVTNVAAQIEVDGVGAGATPFVSPIAVAAGPHIVAVTASGYLPLHREITAAGQTTQRVSLELQPSERRFAHLAIRSAVPGADILVGGQRVGRTPLPGSLAIAPGRQVIELRRAGYRPARQEVTLDDGAVGELSFELAEDESATGPRGRLTLAMSEPDPDVTVDGRSRGAYRGPLSLPAGPHRLTLARAGFLPVERDVVVPESAEGTVQITLVPTPETRAGYKQHARGIRHWDWLTTLGGVALAAGAGAVYAWNRAPLADARAATPKIQAREPCLTALKTTAAENPDCTKMLNAADVEFNKRENIQTFSLVAMSAGVAAAVVGAVLLLTSTDPDRYDRVTGDDPDRYDRAPPHGSELSFSAWIGQRAGGGGFVATF